MRKSSSWILSSPSWVCVVAFQWRRTVRWILITFRWRRSVAHQLQRLYSCILMSLSIVGIVISRLWRAVRKFNSLFYRRKTKFRSLKYRSVIFYCSRIFLYRTAWFAVGYKMKVTKCVFLKPSRLFAVILDDVRMCYHIVILLYRLFSLRDTLFTYDYACVPSVQLCQSLYKSEPKPAEKQASLS